MNKEENAIYQLKKGIMSYVDTKLSKLQFVKTEIGVISGVGTTQGNKVDVKGAIYDNILSVGNIVFPNNCVVYLFIPNAQYSNMFILGQLDDTPANIVGGSINIGNGKFTVNSSGIMSATNGNFNGSITSDSGTIAGLSITSEGLFKDTTISNVQYSIGIVDPQYASNHGDKLMYVLSGIPNSGILKGFLVDKYGNFLTTGLYVAQGSDFDGECEFNNICRFYGTVYNSTGGIVFTSDENAKKDIEELDLEKTANFILSLDPVEYRFKEGDSNRKHHGLISQKVKEKMGDDDWGLYIDQLVNNDEIELDEDGSVKQSENKEKEYPKGLRYDELIADLIATCKYQQNLIDNQQKEIDEINKKLNNKKEDVLDGTNQTDSITS